MGMYMAGQGIGIGLLVLGGTLAVIKLYAFCCNSHFVLLFSL